MRRRRLHRGEHRLVVGERLAVGLVASAKPPAGASATTSSPGRARRAATRRSRRRVADDVSRVPARRVQRALDLVGEDGLVDSPHDGWPAGVPCKRRREDVVLALERRKHELPGALRVGEAVETDERGPEPPRCEAVKAEGTAGRYSARAP